MSKKKNLLIVMTVTYCGNRIGLSTNLHIDSDLWDARCQRVKGDNLAMRMSEAQINFTLEMLKNGVSIVMHNFERLNVIPTVGQFKRSFKSYRVSFGQAGRGIQPVPAAAATPVTPTAPLFCQPMPYTPWQVQGAGHPSTYPGQLAYPSVGYPFPQLQNREGAILENVENARPKRAASSPTPTFNKYSELALNQG